MAFDEHKSVVTSGLQRRFEIKLGGKMIERGIHNASIAMLVDCNADRLQRGSMTTLFDQLEQQGALAEKPSAHSKQKS